MGLVTDIAYAAAALLTMPFWLISLWRRGKLRTDWLGRLGLRALPPTSKSIVPGHRRVLIHAVSVGEVNAIRLLADELGAEGSGVDVVITSTTDTGLARARASLGERHQVVRFPLDFSWAMKQLLDATRPDLVLLTELEVWPNFLRQCRRRGIPVAVVNGRLSERSYRRSALCRPVLTGMFSSLARVCAQDRVYAERFVAMGTPSARVVVTGTMKWDTAEVADTVAGAAELAQAMGVDSNRKLIVAGSTAPGEEAMLAEACPPGVQLMCAPRKPEWFDSAAKSLPQCTRRSQCMKGGSRTHGADRFLLDTIGELRKAYAVADLVVIGRSFGNLHGSDMMEPAALGKAIVVGPQVGDFQATADTMVAAKAIVQCSKDALRATLAELMALDERRAALGAAARAVVLREQGATSRHVAMALELLGRTSGA